MTSAAPAKKPYRKAPPEHRELRLEVPGSRLEQEVRDAYSYPGWQPRAPEAGCLTDFSHPRGLLGPRVGVWAWHCRSTPGELLAAALLAGAM